MTINEIGKFGIVPVVVLEDAENAVDTAKALMAGGIGVMEITMRTSAALESIRRVRAEMPGMITGAGTVINLDQCKACVEAGAQFIVSPGFDGEMAQWCVDNGIVIIPGCVTPTEIMAALKLGIDTLKFFPANVYGGMKAMKALSAPFGGVKFVPTGGVNAENLAEFAASPIIAAIGGSWVCTKADISAKNFDKITALSREATDIVKSVKNI